MPRCLLHSHSPAAACNCCMQAPRRARAGVCGWDGGELRVRGWGEAQRASGGCRLGGAVETARIKGLAPVGRHVLSRPSHPPSAATEIDAVSLRLPDRCCRRPPTITSASWLSCRSWRPLQPWATGLLRVAALRPAPRLGRALGWRTWSKGLRRRADAPAYLAQARSLQCAY